MATLEGTDTGSVSGAFFKIRPMTNVVGLSYRDGMTFQDMLYEIRDYVNKTLRDSVTEEHRKIIEQLNGYLEEYRLDVVETKEQWETIFNAYMEDVDASLQALNDNAVAGLVKTPASKLAIALNENFASKVTQTTVESGRLSQDTMMADFAAKSTQTTVETGRLNKAIVNDKLDTYRYGARNTLLGLGAGSLNDGETSTIPSNGGYGLVAVGADALRDNVRGWNNIAVGLAAMADNVDGYNNVAVGDAALERNRGGIGDTGTSNVAPGSRNVGVGSYALRYNTVGYANVGIGRNAAHTNVSGAYNTAVGTNAYSGQYSNGVGDEKQANDNTAIGYNSAFATNAKNNTAVGAHSLYENTGGEAQTAIGWKSLYKSQGRENTALGSDAGFGITTGLYNIAIGNRAMFSDNDGGSNTIIGVGALTSASTGSRNVGIGTSALNMLSAGGSNVAVGWSAGTTTSPLTVNRTVSLGAEAVAQHENSVALGFGSKSTTTDQVNIGPRHLEFPVITGSTTPVDAARLYSIVDNGKVSLAVRFPNGQIKIITAET